MTLPSPKDKPLRRVKKQVVAGFIIYRRTHEGVKFLLLYKRGEYWNFPKGHFEQGEKSMETALRETQEETGLKPEELRIIPGFKTYEKFHFFRGQQKIEDTVILYLAETKQAEVKISTREHSGYAWFLYGDAIKVLRRYNETKRVLKQAHDFIRRKSARRRPENPTGKNPKLRGGGYTGGTSPSAPSSRDSIKKL
ncbi:MAG: NUDIX domain-containing protein [Anaplasmataceae bacterium]|nr:NUDIX domain-containing protein [Anaplasmataceae bacterium]